MNPVRLVFNCFHWKLTRLGQMTSREVRSRYVFNLFDGGLLNSFQKGINVKQPHERSVAAILFVDIPMLLHTAVFESVGLNQLLMSTLEILLCALDLELPGLYSSYLLSELSCSVILGLFSLPL
jgi:hypothetical protein